ncbi:MAG: glutamate racemase [Planctomycetia bacterium]|nr:glutamate racemase [Planctomycetia bacterium]
MKQPIAIFDSGLGGLTVVKQIRRTLPGEDIVYFGDTARVPYGIKSQTTVTRFAAENCRFLLRFNPKMIVAACNTASATSLPALQEMFSIPVCGVIEPGAARAVQEAGKGPIGIIGTESTVESGAYHEAIRRLDPQVQIVAQACPLLVPLVEEGRRWRGGILASVLKQYLEPFMHPRVSCLVLGCTHYPLLKGEIRKAMGSGVALVDSAEAVAGIVRNTLEESGELGAEGQGGDVEFWVSDNPARFARLGERFLEEPIDRIQLLSPEEFFASGPDGGLSVAGRPCALDLPRQEEKS